MLQVDSVVEGNFELEYLLLEGIWYVSWWKLWYIHRRLGFRCRFCGMV